MKRIKNYAIPKYHFLANYDLYKILFTREFIASQNKTINHSMPNYSSHVKCSQTFSILHPKLGEKNTPKIMI